MASDGALASALSALGLEGDALDTLRKLPDPLALRVLAGLEAVDLELCAMTTLLAPVCARADSTPGPCSPRSLAASGDERLRNFAAAEVLWQPLCVKRWGATCSAEVRCRERVASNFGTFSVAPLLPRPRADAAAQLYGGVWRDCYAARQAIDERLLKRFDQCVC